MINRLSVARVRVARGPVMARREAHSSLRTGTTSSTQFLVSGANIWSSPRRGNGLGHICVGIWRSILELCHRRSLVWAVPVVRGVGEGAGDNQIVLRNPKRKNPAVAGLLLHAPEWTRTTTDYRSARPSTRMTRRRYGLWRLIGPDLAVFWTHWTSWTGRMLPRALPRIVPMVVRAE
jgi:hypothetical protein